MPSKGTALARPTGRRPRVPTALRSSPSSEAAAGPKRLGHQQTQCTAAKQQNALQPHRPQGPRLREAGQSAGAQLAS